MPPLFCLPRAVEWFFLQDELVLFFPSLTANLLALVLGICTRAHHLWGLSVKVLIDQTGAFSPTAEAGPTSTSTSTKQHHQLS